MPSFNRSSVIIAPLRIQANNQFLHHFYVVISVIKEEFYNNNTVINGANLVPYLYDMYVLVCDFNLTALYT